MTRKLHQKAQAITADNPIASTFGKSPVTVRIVVGIGASAGGLDAFKTFFQHMPSESGIAFVLVSHLDPDHESLLATILQRNSTMPVCTAEHRMPLQANSVYVLPPNREITLVDGVLQLALPSMPHGQRMPINTFLTSLAADQGARSVAIILSGTGNDGTNGLAAIRKAGGVCIVQDPKTTLFSGMPCSAIEADELVQVLAVQAMPDFLLGLTQRGSGNAMPTAGQTLKASEIKPILSYLHSQTGHDFSQYKHNTMARRVRRRMQLQGIDNPLLYARFLQDNSKEIQSLFKELLINVTAFFRDPPAFDFLKNTILPALYKNRVAGDTFRVWVAGGSTGEEAYSIAIVLHEFLTEHGLPLNLQIYSTDISDEVTAFARAGCYPLTITATLSEQRLKQFFSKENSGYRISRSIREKVVFAKQNITQDPPFTRLDLLSCRNVLIYLESSLQESLLPLFHYALKPGGILFFSPSESIGKHTELFTAVDRTWKFYRTTRTLLTTHSLQRITLLCAKPGTRKDGESVTLSVRPNLPEITRRALLTSFAPASVLTDQQGNILYVHGDTGDFLRPAPGEATLRIVDMAIAELQEPLQTALRSVADSGVAYTRELILTGKEENRAINLIVRNLANPESGNHLVLISFQIMIAPSHTKERHNRPDVQAIIGMGINLGMSVVAEGVETVYQADFLSQHRCSILQGNLLSLPLKQKAFEDYLSSHVPCPVA